MSGIGSDVSTNHVASSICEGCKKQIDDVTMPAQVSLLPHKRATDVCARGARGARGRTGWCQLYEIPGVLTYRVVDVALFCTVRCMRDWCDRILEIG